MNIKISLRNGGLNYALGNIKIKNEKENENENFKLLIITGYFCK